MSWVYPIGRSEACFFARDPTKRGFRSLCKRWWFKKLNPQPQHEVTKRCNACEYEASKGDL